MRSSLALAPELRRNVFMYDSRERAIADDPVEHFRAADLICIDGIEWPAMEEVRRGLIDKRRKFGEPFHAPDEIKASLPAMDAIAMKADDLFCDLYPFPPMPRKYSFRPMITGPEPIHFDTDDAPQPVVTAFINVATTPRRYSVGPTFADLVRDQPDQMRQIIANGGNTSYAIRGSTVRGEGPLLNSGPAHRVDFAPGAIWFFCAKRVSHQIVYGAGAIGRSWILPPGSAPMQVDLLRELH